MDNFILFFLLSYFPLIHLIGMKTTGYFHKFLSSMVYHRSQDIRDLVRINPSLELLYERQDEVKSRIKTVLNHAPVNVTYFNQLERELKCYMSLVEIFEDLEGLKEGTLSLLIEEMKFLKVDIINAKERFENTLKHYAKEELCNEGAINQLSNKHQEVILLVFKFNQILIMSKKFNNSVGALTNIFFNEEYI